MSAEPMSVNALSDFIFSHTSFLQKTRLLAAQLSDIAMAMDRDVRGTGLGVPCITEPRENPGWEGENSHLNSFNKRICNFKSS